MKKLSILLIITTIVLLGCKPENQDSSKGKYAIAIETSRTLMDSLLAAGKTPGLDIAISIHAEVVWSEDFGYYDTIEFIQYQVW